MIREHFSLPVFDSPDAEQAFWNDRDARTFRTRRAGMIVGAVFFLLFGVLDIAVGGDQWSSMLAIRIGANLIAIATIWYFCQSRSAAEREWAILIYGLAGILTGVAFTVLAPPAAAGYYQFGLAVIIGFGAVVIVPRFATIAALYTAVLVSYSLSLPLSNSSTMALAINGTFVVFTATAVLIGSLEREKLERLQAMSEAKLARANAELSASQLEALKSRDTAVAANRAKNQFVASVSHELRTPMNAIIGFSDVMKNELFGAIEPARYREYIDLIHSSGLLLQANIDDLLDLSRIEAGKMGWSDERFGLRMTLKNAIATCQSQADAAQVALHLEEHSERIYLEADAARISQALINLITNAVKFSDNGGTVTVSCHLDAVGALGIAVTDTGCGMSPDQVERVCEPFAQAHSDSDSKAKGGLGLGLAIVSGIVSKIDGRLDLESEEGVGTTASITIPAERVFVVEAQAA